VDGVYASLSYWYHLLVAFSIVMGLEAPLLLFVAMLRRRRRYEQAVALLPAAGFALGLFLARRAETTLSYVFFQQAHYPPRYWPTFAREQGSAGLQKLANSLQQQATLMGVLTFALLIGGCVLLLRWPPYPHYETDSALSTTAMELPTGDDLGTDDNLEITIEPIDLEKQ
jgi:hypothetical protein